MSEKSAFKPDTATEIFDAIALLEADHAEVKTAFDAFEDLETEREKKALANKICIALIIHAQIEEEIFYPAARKAMTDDDLLDEATVEHACAKTLIAEIEAMEPNEPLYDAKVKVLGEQIRHHVKEEEQELFPMVRKTDIDLKKLGARLSKRKAELTSQMTPEHEQLS